MLNVLQVQPCIDIVLATYNGAVYLKEQIESIQNNQAYSSLVKSFIIIDDGSSDATEEIVADYASSDSLIKWVPSSGKSLGPSGNFCRGIELTSAPLVMLCDQDDVWFEDKIVTSYESIKPYIGSAIPALAYSEMHIVDNRCQLIADSYFKFKSIPYSWPSDWGNLLQQNTVSGCTSIFNRALIDKSLPIPSDAYMHDWWLALVAKQFGVLIFIEKPLIAYRQHQFNTIGAKKRSLRGIGKQFQRFEQSVHDVVKQAAAFLRIYGKEMDELEAKKELEQLRVISELPRSSLMKKISLYQNGMLGRSHALGTVLLMIVVLLKL
ncbi:glycosyltransferase family 2 protein [Vibrio rotiferianus]|uniref:glycosyltransferase family 2 protein n=1 Tax=Vibrio rotiferianus TaxID=190895 RepID=UPI00039D906A|nr:glycosyltransferase family 2 protein [Vibrio rotiferianus]PIB18031.1 glycosyl transferase family protein [Vibrio rotiferianus CAIM 577 = LMG 21460]